ncbi:MAG TPA: ABC transporter permease [Candidatus Eisenbacteria bacterium]|jgi:simple sugar transport system permease protein
MSAPAARTAPRVPWVALAPLAAVVLALAAGGLLIAAVGQSPLEVYGLLVREAFGTGYGLGQTLFKATPLVFTGLSVALAFRAGLFNVGTEGQMYLGGFAAGLVGAYAPLPAPLLLPAALVAAALAGAAWGAVPGVLKARFGAHEVINTIMLNFIAFALVSWWGRSLFVAATVRTREVAAAARVPRLDVLVPWLKGSPANFALLLGFALAVGLGVFLFRTRRGYELRVLGLNLGAAEYAGVRTGVAQVQAFALAGALAGLGGVSFVLGYKHWFEQDFTAGAGFMGIAVALIGRSHPLGVLLAAIFFGALAYGGLVVNQRVPSDLVNVLRALVILFAISSHALFARWARRSGA